MGTTKRISNKKRGFLLLLRGPYQIFMQSVMVRVRHGLKQYSALVAFMIRTLYKYDRAQVPSNDAFKSVPATSRRWKCDKLAVAPAAGTLPTRRLYYYIISQKKKLNAQPTHPCI